MFPGAFPVFNGAGSVPPRWIPPPGGVGAATVLGAAEEVAGRTCSAGGVLGSVVTVVSFDAAACFEGDTDR